MTDLIIKKVIDTLSWDTIYEVNKCFKHGIGEGTSAIPGLKKKVFSDKLTKNDIRNELRSILKYVISNNVPEFVYGNWMIFWNDDIRDIYNEEDMESLDIPISGLSGGPSIEVIYTPQRIYMGNIKIIGGKLPESDDNIELNRMLKNAEDNEQYELASKIRDVIKLQDTK
jgi:hypothetical protein